MVTDCKMNTLVDNDLLSFLKKNNCSGFQFELLRFIGQHPKAKISFATITNALGATEMDAWNALISLIESDFVTTEGNEKGLVIYSLSDDWQIGIYVSELANMDRSTASSLKKQLQ